MKSQIIILLFFIMGLSNVRGQTISASIPEKANKSDKYVFYLHGGIIQAHGVDAVSPYWGRYEYTGILDTLSSYGYYVISEARPKDTDLLKYAAKITKEIKTLLKLGVAPENIIVLGASMGAGMAIDISIRVKTVKSSTPLWESATRQAGSRISSITPKMNLNSAEISCQFMKVRIGTDPVTTILKMRIANRVTKKYN